MAAPARPRRSALASLLAQASGLRLLIGACALLLVLGALGVAAWPCPLAEAAGVPCPGCGLGRSVLASARGELGHALELHAFGPLVLLVLVGLAVAALLPGRLRARAASLVARVEATGLDAALLLGLVAYWLARVLAGTAPTVAS